MIAVVRHLRLAIEILEDISHRSADDPPPPTAPAVPPPQERTAPAGKLTYTLKEAARAIGVSRTSLYRAIKEGDLEVVKFGHRTLVPCESVRNRLTPRKLKR